MRRELCKRRLTLTGAAAILLISGCASSDSTSSVTIRRQSMLCSKDLNDYQRIMLSLDKVSASDGPLSTDEYLQLTVRLMPREHLSAEYTARLDSECGREVRRIEHVEGRTDAARRKFWFVDRDTRRVIMTVDRDTGRITGPNDEPPDWATPDGGEPL